MADSWPGTPAPPALQALSDLRRRGAVVTNGFRTDDDYYRLKREGYTPARNGAHPNGNGVDLAPGGQFRTLGDLQRAALQSFGPNAVVEIHNNSHVHVATPDFMGDAPDVTRGRQTGWPGQPVDTAKRAGSLGQLLGSTSPLALTGKAHDGDTVGLANGRNGRLFGFDAFELGQKGTDASGRPVSLGSLSRDFMLSRIGQGMAANPTGASTYGRPVINLSPNPYSDPARDAIRRGLGIAEPKYLKGSPQFTPYMDAERQAAMNKLGGFATNAVTPEAFRRRRESEAAPQAGQYGKDALAIFADEPIPFQGLKPEIVKGYLDLSHKGSADELVAYAKANGFQIDPATAAKFVKERDSGAKVDYKARYERVPRPLINLGDGATGAAIRGFGDPINALDEFGAIANSLLPFNDLDGPRINVWNAPPGTRFGDVYGANLEQNREILGSDEASHPYARMAGQLTSGIALPMGAASTPGRLAALMGTEGALAGALAGEGSISSRVPNAAAGAVLGTAGGTVLGTAGQHIVSPLVQRYLARRAVKDAEAMAQDATSEAIPIVNDEIQNAGPTPAARSQPQGGVTAAMAAERGPEIVGPAPRERDYLNVKGADWPGLEVGRKPDVSEVTPGAILTPRDNSVASMDEALKANPSRFQDMAIPNPSDALPAIPIRRQGDFFNKATRRDVYDVTKFLRAHGGIQDWQGELAHAGITNAPRRDLPFGRNEQFLGKLVNPEGRTLDDAGELLWEAGYFRERPTVAELLDVLRGEQFGQYHYHPEDLDYVAEFDRLAAQRGAMENAAQEGAPFADDTSEPVNLDDLLKHTAPAYAYSEVPTRKIGNLDVTKIEGSDDLARAMQHIEEALGDHPAQAAISNEQTKAAAHELGMSVQEFLKKQPGQFDSKSIIAGRMLLHGALEATRRAALKVVKNGSPEDKLAFERAKFVTALIQDHMKGATAEIGRTLQALKIVSTKDDARLAAVREAIRGRGGHDRIEDSAAEFLELAEDPAKANRFIAKDTKASALQMFNEVVTMARLSNPVTHARNFLGNALSTAVSFPESAVEAGLGKARSIVSKAAGRGEVDRSYISEVGARARGVTSALPEAMRNMAKVFRTGEPIDGVSKVEAHLHFRAIPGRAGEVIRIPGRAMTAADEAWKTLIYADHINALARRQGIQSGLKGAERSAMEAQLRNNPTPEMLSSAHIEARYRTFQQELGKWGTALQNISNTFPGAKILLTFVRTPINLVKFAGERSVFAPAMPSVIRKLKAGGRARDEALSRIIVGSTISTAATAAALNGHISGQGPDDYRQKAALMATGWRPNSIRIGDKWVSYQGLDPVSTLVAVAADFAEAGKWATPNERQNIATNLTLSAAESASNRTWMGGVADFFDALHDPKHAAGPFLKSQAAGLVPAGLGQATAYSDPYLRQAQTTLEAVKARVPGLSNSLPVKRDIWGDPLKRDTALGPDMVSPFRYGEQSSDPVNAEVARLAVMLTPVSRKLKDDDGNSIELTAEQYDQLVQLAGKPAKEALAKEISSPEWRRLSDDEKRKTIREIVNDFRDAARDTLRDQMPVINSAPAWPGQKVDHSETAWPGQEVHQPSAAKRSP